MHCTGCRLLTTTTTRVGREAVGFLGVVVEVTLAVVPDDLVFRHTEMIPLEVRCDCRL
jgi:hypothetical protein